ncbi:DUF262 domain-containing protein [Methylobacillus sp. Pita2]|uniref:DUF262 domain-containing protein n=1 Tax=Methylobacillus sp. Pita2 TaxID=3383245 RepID=UPI0038B506C0
MKTLPDQLYRGNRREFTLDALITIPAITPTHPDERVLLNLVLPPWQRDEVWTDAQKSRFIESIFLGLDIGYYVVVEADWDNVGVKPNSAWLLDGQQRLSAIRDFMDDKIEIFDGIKFSEIDPVVRLKRFLRYPFPRYEVPHSPDVTLFQDLYDRMNFGGTNHTEQDRARLSL